VITEKNMHFVSSVLKKSSWIFTFVFVFSKLSCDQAYDRETMAFGIGNI